MIVEMGLVDWSKRNEARLLQRSATLKLSREGGSTGFLRGGMRTCEAADSALYLFSVPGGVFFWK